MGCEFLKFKVKTTSKIQLWVIDPNFLENIKWHAYGFRERHL